MKNKTKSFELVTSTELPEGTYLFRASDSLPDRDGDRNFVSGWKLDSYRSNPVVLWNHVAHGSEMPIGKANVYTDESALWAEITIDVEDPIGAEADRKIRNGFLNAVSVGYIPTPGKSLPNEFGGIDSLENELLEISLVNIPANQRAVRVKGLSEDDTSRIEELSAAFANQGAESFNRFAKAAEAYSVDMGAVIALAQEAADSFRRELAEIQKSLSTPAETKSIEPEIQETPSELVAAPIVDPVADIATDPAVDPAVDMNQKNLSIETIAQALADGITKHLTQAIQETIQK